MDPDLKATIVILAMVVLIFATMICGVVAYHYLDRYYLGPVVINDLSGDANLHYEVLMDGDWECTVMPGGGKLTITCD